jgi:hypothetical protein
MGLHWQYRVPSPCGIGETNHLDMSSALLIEMGNRVIIVMIKHESRNGVKIMIAFAPGVLRTIIQQICSADAPCFPTCFQMVLERTAVARYELDCRRDVCMKILR